MNHSHTGVLARRYCGERIPVDVHRSAAGYYLGTVDPGDGSPVSRESLEYWPTEEAARRALETGEWTQRDTP
jgi:hypothetical protein